MCNAASTRLIELSKPRNERVSLSRGNAIKGSWLPSGRLNLRIGKFIVKIIDDEGRRWKFAPWLVGRLVS